MDSQRTDGLHFRTFGGFEISAIDCRPIVPPRRLLRALLALLACSPEKTWTRDQLAEVFWGDRDDKAARGSLRQALAELRKTVGAHIIIAEREIIRLNASRVSSDAAQFEDFVKHREFEKAATIYRGPFLEDVSLPADGFMTWLTMERTRKHDLAIYALTELLKSRSGVEADAVAVRMLEIEPTNEHAHRARMREFATRGDRANAIRQYNACRTSLQADLGVEPDPETEALRNRIEEVGADTQEALEHVDSPFDRTSPEQAAARIPTRWHIISVSGLVLVALLLGWVGYLKIIDQESRTSGAENSIPDAPSIAVLPLRNLTGDAALDYIGDGISTDIIVGLAHIPDISVIGRDSSIMYKDWDVHSRGIAQDLGVQYLLTGTIRKIGDGMRITAELTNVAQNRLVWVKQFDRDLEKVFEVQDEITLQIVDELEVEIAEGEQALLRRRTTTLPEAYKLFRFAEDSIRRGSKDDLRRGLAYARKAVELDPNFAAGWGILGWLIMQERHFYGDSTGDWLAEPEKYARKALSLDPGHAPGLMLLSFAEMYKRNFQKSLEYGDRAISNWPGSSDINAVYALVLDAAGKYEQASHHIERAMRLSPHYPGWHAKMAGEIMLRLGHFEKAIAYYDEALARNPEDFMLASALSGKAVALKSLGRDREARKSIGSIVEAVPWFTLQYVRDDFSFQKDSDALQSFVDDLRQLGLPEQ